MTGPAGAAASCDPVGLCDTSTPVSATAIAAADVAIALKPKIDALLQQGPGEAEPFQESRSRLLALAMEAGAMLQSAAKGGGGVVERRA